MSWLYFVHEMTQSELQRKTKIPWGSFSSHLEILKKHEYLSLRNTMTGWGKRSIVTITPQGISAYDKFTEDLNDFLKNPPARLDNDDFHQDDK